MARSKRAVVFDIGGILELTPETDWRARWAERLGISAAEIARRGASLWSAGAVGALTTTQYEAGLAEAFSLGSAEVSELVEDLWTEYLGEPNVELIEYFASLRAQHLTGIISNSFIGAREREQARYGFADLCDSLVYSHEVGIAKPDHRIYHISCEQLGVAPADVVFLDDVEENIAAADAVGMHGVLYRDNAQAMRAIADFLAR
ncbi:MAG: HAD family phosphatase [Myxococcales bacterium]|nr:HAD family phosphatase [Myxococcales bacterium]